MNRNGPKKRKTFNPETITIQDKMLSWRCQSIHVCTTTSQCMLYGIPPLSVYVCVELQARSRLAVHQEESPYGKPQASRQMKYI